MDHKLSIIIPARNEEQRIKPLLESLRSQQAAFLEIIVVDDESQDNTAALAQSYGARVVKPAHKPPGWNGKSWACWQGAQQAKGDLLLFLDADVVLKREALAMLINKYEYYKAPISVQPYHKIKHFYENISAFVNLVVIAGVDAFSIFSPMGKPAGAFGPCLLMAKNTYFNSGGHKAVSRHIVDDMALAQHIVRKNKLYCFLGKGSFEYRMYPAGLADLIEGWSKNLISAKAQSGQPSVVLLALWITGIFSSFSLPFYFVFGLSLLQQILMAIIVFIYVVQIFYLLRKVGNFNLICALLYPVSVLLFIMLLIISFIKTRIFKKVKWKGRRLHPL